MVLSLEKSVAICLTTQHREPHESEGMRRRAEEEGGMTFSFPSLLLPLPFGSHRAPQVANSEGKGQDRGSRGEREGTVEERGENSIVEILRVLLPVPREEKTRAGEEGGRERMSF
jgi:hypothetical protein